MIYSQDGLFSRVHPDVVFLISGNWLKIRFQKISLWDNTIKFMAAALQKMKFYCRGGAMKNLQGRGIRNAS